MTQTPHPPAGWYPQGSQERWWDGTAWSDNFRPLGSDTTATTPQPTYAQPTYAQPTYAQPGYAQPAYGQPQYAAPQPAQKSHLARNLLIVFGVLVLLFVGGCTALVYVAYDKVDEAVNDDTVGGPNNPLTITEGQAFEVAGFDYGAGWSIGPAQFGGTVEVADLKVTNHRGKADRLIVEIKLLSSNEIVATASCTASGVDKIPEDVTATVECSSSDPMPAAYDTVTIQDSI